MQRNELITPKLASVLRPWFSGITVGAQHVIPHAPAALEQPDHAVTLTWRVNSADPHDIVIMGPRTHARYHLMQPSRDCLQLRFRPGRASDFIGRPVRHLADRVVSVADLYSQPWTTFLQAITESSSLDAPQSHAARLRTLAAALPVAPQSPSDQDALPGRIVADAVMLLSAGDGKVRRTISSVARRLNVSERHLRTVFIDGVGLTPRDFVRIDRVRFVLARIQQKLPEVSVRSGYYDQSHMTGEFHRVMGTTPHAFATRRWPSIQGCVTDKR